MPENIIEEKRNIEIRRRRAELFRNYPGIWDRMIEEWKDEKDGSDCVWLTYAANYLLRTSGIRWAVDPLTVHGRFRGRDSKQKDGGISPEEMQRLQPLSFVLLTHNHADHVDIPLISALKDFPITWVMPEEMREIIREKAGLKDESILTPRRGKAFKLGDIKITAWEGLHRREDPFKAHIPSNVYLVETGRRKLLFPGDVRTYDSGFIPFSGPVDWIFSHLWLGVDSMEADLPILPEFCDFALEFNPKNILISHVYEVGRPAGSYWSEEHVEMARECWRTRAPEVKVFTAEIGEKVKL